MARTIDHKAGVLIFFNTKFKLKPGGYRWVQINHQKHLVRILKLVDWESWRPNQGLGERKYRHTFKGRIVDKNKILPILKASKTVTYGDTNTQYITDLRVD